MALRRFIRFASQPARALPLANAFVYTTPPRSTHSPGELYTSERSAAHTPGAHGDNTLLDLSHLTLLQCARLTPARAPILRRSSLQNISPPCIATSASHTPLAHKLPLCSSSSSSPAYAAIHPLQCPRHSTLRQQNPLFTSKRASCPCCKHVSSENGEEPPSPRFSSR